MKTYANVYGMSFAPTGKATSKPKAALLFVDSEAPASQEMGQCLEGVGLTQSFQSHPPVLGSLRPLHFFPSVIFFFGHFSVLLIISKPMGRSGEAKRDDIITLLFSGGIYDKRLEGKGLNFIAEMRALKNPRFWLSGQRLSLSPWIPDSSQKVHPRVYPFPK